MEEIVQEMIATLADPWAIVGVVAQITFSARFIVQWIQSERAGRSVIPGSFWWLSLIGSTLLLVYAIQIRNPIFMVGQAAGLWVYARNLALLKRASE